MDGKGSVAAQIAKTAGVSQHKAQQAVKASKAGALDDVIAGKTKLQSAAAKAPTKKRKTKVIPFEDQVYKKWTQWLGRFPHPVRREALKAVHGWIGCPLLGRTDRNGKLIMPEKITYHGKGTFTLGEVMADDFNFGEPRRPSQKPVKSEEM